MTFALTTPRQHLRRMWPAWLVLAISLVPGIVGVIRIRSAIEDNARVKFDEHVRRATEALRNRVEHHADELQSLRGLFAASRDVELEEWEAFVREMEMPRRYPGLRAVGYAEKVEPGQKEAFLARMRNVNAGFSVRPGGERPVYFPTVYLTYFQSGRPAGSGFDVASESNRLHALRLAVVANRPMMTRKVALAGPDGSSMQQGFVIFTPVYRHGARLATVEDREAALQGVVASSAVSDRYLAGIPGFDQAPLLRVEVFDGPTTDPENLLGARPAKLPVGSGDRVVEAPVTVLNRLWTLRFTALPEFEIETASTLPLLAGVLAFTISFLLFGITSAQVRARLDIEGHARDLAVSKDALRAANDRLHAQIVEHDATQTRLTHERGLMQEMLDSMPDRIYFKDARSRFIKYGRAVLATLGPSAPASIEGKTDADLFGPEHAAAALADEQEILRAGKPIIGKVEHETWRDGRETWVLTTKLPLRADSGVIIGTFGISKDITALVQAEKALEAEKELLTTTLRSIADGVITTDTAGRVVLFNTVAAQLTGWPADEAVGHPLSEVFRTLDEKTRQPDSTPLSDPTAPSHQDLSLLVSRDGFERNIARTAAPIRDHNGRTLGTVLVFRDITDKLRADAELFQASRLESIGLLAGGIAHDFNNVLTAILGNVTLARLSNDDPARAAAALQRAEEASLRARHITQQLLTFARGGAPIKKALHLKTTLLNVIRMVEHAAGITVEFHAGDNLRSIEADEAQIGQALHNILLHATHAAPPDTRVQVRVENAALSPANGDTAPVSDHLQITITDHGPVLPAEALARIFEPYSTPKKSGGGLGLATAHSIIRRHEGQMAVTSAPATGTVFQILLPASAAPAAAPAPILPAAVPSVASQPLRVLVMDDEPDIRTIARAVLQRAGHTVDEAPDGETAIAHYQKALAAGTPFHVVILDLTIPNGLGGRETIQRLRELDPHVTAIVSSGYSNDPVMAQYREHGFRAVVPKPYRLADLRTAVEALAAQPR